MARYVEQGKSIFIPFRNGFSIMDSQRNLRMYKTVEMFNRYGYTCGEVDVLCEYAPVVRCEKCEFWDDSGDGMLGHCKLECDGTGCDDGEALFRWATDFCSYGERRENGKAKE